MRTELVRIGNSYGIRIPKPFIRQCKLRNVVEIHIENGCIVVSARRMPRDGWNEAFLAAGPSAKDEPLLKRMETNQFDLVDWQW